jgi:hypothetical protein
MKYYIYTLTDPVDNLPKYIGKTKNLKDRLRKHLLPSYLTNIWLPKSKWIIYLKKNGLKPIMEILDEGDENNINDLEIYWISQFKTWGFKLKNATDGGIVITPKGMKRKNIFKFKINNKSTKEVYQYLIKTGELITIYNSIEEAEKILDIHNIIDYCQDTIKYYDKYFFRFKNEYFPYKKEVCQYSIETDELIAEYKSLHYAETSTGVGREHISNCCKGLINSNSAGGYYWRFKDNYFSYKRPSNKKVKIEQYDCDHILINKFSSISELIKNNFGYYGVKNSSQKKLLYKGFYWKIIY